MKNQKRSKVRLAIIGAYLFDDKIFDCIRKTKHGVGNEIQITGAINLLFEEEDVYAYEFNGKRYDIGNPYLRPTANIAFALKRDDLRADIEKFLNNLE